jgi:ankyrin repeat protein
LGHDLVVQFLLSLKGIDVNKGDREMVTPLMAAAMSMHVRSMRLLLQTPGIDVNKQDFRGMTALHFAIRTQLDAVVAELVQMPQINPNIPENSMVYFTIRDLHCNMLRNSTSSNSSQA